jgi:hypothetical protein
MSDLQFHIFGTSTWELRRVASIALSICEQYDCPSTQTLSVFTAMESLTGRAEDCVAGLPRPL